MSAGIMTGARGAPLDVGEAVGGVTPAPWMACPTKPGPDRTKGPYTPWEEPWWNAGRRAVLFRSEDGAALQKGAEVDTQRPFRRSASFLLFVIATPSEARGKQSSCETKFWIASSLSLLAMTRRRRVSRTKHGRHHPCHAGPKTFFALHVAEI
jgi:hypothetical protein